MAAVATTMAFLATALPAAADPSMDVIRSRYNESKCLDIYEFNNSNGAPVVSWDCNGKVNQRWAGVEARPGRLEFRSKWNGKCLTQVFNNAVGINKAVMADCLSPETQDWYFDLTKDTLCLAAKPHLCLKADFNRNLHLGAPHEPPLPHEQWYVSTFP